jgi:hypothetical protein
MTVSVSMSENCIFHPRLCTSPSLYQSLCEIVDAHDYSYASCNFIIYPASVHLPMRNKHNHPHR